MRWRKFSLEALAISPSGRHAVALHGRSLRYAFDNRVKPLAYLYDLDSGTRRLVFEDAGLNIKDFRWAPDGAGFYAINEHSSQTQFCVGVVTELYYYDLGAGAAARIELSWDAGLATMTENEEIPGFCVMPDGFLALLANGVPDAAALVVKGAIIAGAVWSQQQGRSA